MGDNEDGLSRAGQARGGPDPRIRFDVKSSARVWNYWLGGKDNYEVDRKAGDEYIELFPQIVEIARADRQFLIRAVSYLAAEVGIRQFLDIGTGLPTMQNTHEVAQSIAPDARIVYVDNDPIVLAHARALLLANSTTEGTTTYLDADVRDPESIIEQASATLDFAEPVAVMLLGILGHAAGTFEQMDSIMRRLLATLSPGSYLVLGDGVELGHPGQRQASGKHAYHLRTPEQFQQCLRGLELVAPGLVAVNHWRPTLSLVGGCQPAPLRSYVAVARKP